MSHQKSLSKYNFSLFISEVETSAPVEQYIGTLKEFKQQGFHLTEDQTQQIISNNFLNESQKIAALEAMGINNAKSKVDSRIRSKSNNRDKQKEKDSGEKLQTKKKNRWTNQDQGMSM